MCMHEAFGFARAATRVEHEERIIGVHVLWRALGVILLEHVVHDNVTTGRMWLELARGTHVDEHVSYAGVSTLLEGRIDGLLQLDVLATANTLVGSDDSTALGFWRLS